jgi:DNA-binding transcriptional ArsR family regulator
MKDFDCAPALKALSKPVCLRIVRLLSKEPLSVNEVAARLKMPQYKVSRHLQILRDAGLLEVHNHGKKHFHQVPIKQLAHNRNTLDLGCCAFRFDKL